MFKLGNVIVIKQDEKSSECEVNSSERHRTNGKGI